MKDEITKILDLIENEKDKHWNRQEELLNNLGYGGSAQDQIHDAELEMDAYCVLNDLQCRIESLKYKKENEDKKNTAIFIIENTIEDYGFNIPKSEILKLIEKYNW